MLVAHWECKHHPLNNTGKDLKLTSDFEILTFSLARGFVLALSLGMTTPLIAPVMDISWPCILGKECFDMLKSIGFGDLVRLLSSSRRSDRVYLGWFVRDLLWRLFRMQASRRSVKVHWSFHSIGSSLSTGFQVYLSKCWDPYVSPGWTIRLVFFCSFSAMFQHVHLVTTSPRAGFQVYLS